MSVRVETSGPVSTVILSRPAVKNAVDAATAAELRAAFAEFAARNDQLVAVLWGEGGTFCAGYDLEEAMAGDVGYDPVGPGPMGPTRHTLPKPVIAAVEGYAVAGGLELALWCDMRVVAEGAAFGVFCRRWGVPLVDGGTIRLPRLIGQGRALDMILTGREVAAAEALSWGLADRLVPDGTARRAAEQLALEIARFPQACMRADRYSSLTQWGREIDDALATEATGGLTPLETIAEQIAPFFAETEE
jgi:enoyl-CoA hydratase